MNDRNTREPQLSPRLAPFQLWCMANEPGWRPWMRLIAKHPSAWPELVEWADTGEKQGFDTVGAAPRPPESKEGLFSRLVKVPTPSPPDIPAGPSDDATDAGNDDKPGTGQETEPRADDADAGPDDDGDAEPYVRDGAEPPASNSAGETPQAQSVEALAAVADADEAWNAMPDGDDDDTQEESRDAKDFDDAKVRRAIPVKRILLIVAAILAVMALIATGLRITAGRNATNMQADHETAIAGCEQARKTAMDTWDRLDAKTEEAGKLADATGRDQVKDTKTLDALGKLADAKPAKPREQCTAAMDTKTLGDTAGRLAAATTTYRQAIDRLDQTMDGVEKSKLDKAIDQAQRLYDDSAGKVADGETRQTLLNAIRQRDGKAIGTAVKQVNDSMQAKTEADQEKHAAEEEARRQAEAAQAQAQQQAQQQTQRRQTVTPRRNYNYGGGSGGGPRTYKPATPTPSPAPTPAAPSKPSGNDGAFVG